MARNDKDKGRRVSQSTGGRSPSGIRYSGRDMRRYPSGSRDERRGAFVGRGSRKSGWHDEPRRHSLARMGINTVLPDGRRLDVSRFVAGGKELSMKEIADITGLVWDGGDDTRLFDDEMIRVSAWDIGEKRYNEMEKEIGDFSIVRDKYEVHVANDSSGFDYWNRDDETNYIMTVVEIKDTRLSEKDLDQIVDDVETAFFEFNHYDYWKRDYRR